LQISDHPIALSFSDLSIWCYQCESYIKSPKLSPAFKLAHEDKFSKTQPGQEANSFIISNKPQMSDEEIREYFDEPKVLQEKVKELAALIRSSRYLVVYTGAGVSTSAKVPDYRGPRMKDNLFFLSFCFFGPSELIVSISFFKRVFGHSKSED
jgi:hypothetical protein